jgi:hypothetical protein
MSATLRARALRIGYGSVNTCQNSPRSHTRRDHCPAFLTASPRQSHSSVVFDVKTHLDETFSIGVCDMAEIVLSIVVYGFPSTRDVLTL